MALVTTSVWVRRESEFRVGLAVGEPVITIESNAGAADVQIFLGNSYAADGISVTLDQLDRLAAAVEDARRVYLASLAAPAELPAVDEPTGPDDPTDEPTDEPAVELVSEGRLTLAGAEYLLGERGIPVTAEPGSLAGRLVGLGD